MRKQYAVCYKKNGKWYRDGERHNDEKHAVKRLEELKKKYDECKVVSRFITLWEEEK